MKIEENSMIQTMRELNVEVEKIGDIGETADHLEILNDPADIFLKYMAGTNFNSAEQKWNSADLHFDFFID